jgi:caffeoyl-CoA O-methyltransferase
MKAIMNKIIKYLSVFILLLAISSICFNAFSQAEKKANNSDKDKIIQQFLDESRNSWSDMNVPYQDGKVLYDLIIKNNYKSALEIGTSTGHSSIWIAWALSKTGGKLVTIEINEGRHNEAVENIRKVGLFEFVDARLADAHKLVKELNGPFDFVFSDADKDWYTQYFKDIDPKLKTGGCFTAHNVLNGYGGTKEFVNYIKVLKNYDTTINNSSSSGISISYKK